MTMGMDKKITVYQDRPYKELGDLFGLFFEDINHAADGGLYGELVQNRSFEFCGVDHKSYHPLTAWEKSEHLAWEVRKEAPLNGENPHYLHVEAAAGDYIQNCGFHPGIFVEAGESYDFSCYGRLRGRASLSGGVPSGRITVSVEEAGKVLAEADFTIQGGDWEKQELVLHATGTTYSGRLVLTFTEGGSLDLDMVSLFPQNTFLGKKGGLRRDIAEALCEMKPKFMRFPGGCLIHDGSLDDHARNSMYRWRRTLGPVEARPTWRNNWGYNQTLGLGYYEYFCFCEEIGAKPLPVLPGGFNPHKGEGAPLEEIGGWVQEALDLIEFATGGRDTEYGAIRARMGHEEPFGLEYIGIGNEEVGAGFFERYPYFHRAIREKYPWIKIINTAGPFAAGESYEEGWSSARRWGSDLVDEHYYSSPEWFLANMHRYEDYDDKGPKVFLGEYASWGNTWYNALVEAAYMTHLERARAVALACYAPMLANVDYVNWSPDMLMFDAHRILKTANYHVQKLFMVHQGTEEVQITTENLAEVVPLVDQADMEGRICVTGNDVTGRIWDVRIRDAGTGQEIVVPGFGIGPDNREHVLAEAASSGAACGGA